jgi:hypothetical protein
MKAEEVLSQLDDIVCDQLQVGMILYRLAVSGVYFPFLSVISAF